MQQYQREFIEFCLKTNVLRFGEFTLKSGRVSPYFFNAGLFNTGSSMLQLSKFFAASIDESKIEFDLLFGPAYKGITLSCGTAMALSDLTGKDIPYAYNRKEKKDHGEGGNIVGAPLAGKILIIDDVITAGTAIRESMDLIAAAEAEAAGVVIALDRQEKGKGERSAIQEVEQDYRIPVKAIIQLENITEYLVKQGQDEVTVQKINDYRSQYGI